MDARTSVDHHEPPTKLSQLWQAPMLLASLGLFGWAAYLFIDPKPGLSIDQKIDSARVLLKNERPDAALNALNLIITTDTKLDRERESAIHLLLGEALDAAQKDQHIDLPANRKQIVQQLNTALELGIKPSADIERRLGESYEVLGKPANALDHYRQAMALDTSHALHLQRKVIDLQLAQKDVGPAEASLDEYLKTTGLADGERAWALCEQAKLLVDRGELVRSRELLDEAMKLDADPATQGQVNYFLGYCEYKLGDPAEGERLLRAARMQLQSTHPLDAEAACLLGKIYQDRSDWPTAESFFQDVLTNHPGCPAMRSALLGRAMCRLNEKQLAPSLADFKELTAEVEPTDPAAPIRLDTLAGLGRGASQLSRMGEYTGAIELLDNEQQLRPQPTADFFARLGDVYAARADQLDQTVDPADPAERIRRSSQIRDCRTKAGDALVANSRSLTLANDKGYGEALWKGIDLYDRAGALASMISALDLFVAERPDDALAPSALLRLGRAYQAAGQFDKAISAFQRNQFRYPNSLAASKSAVPLAEAYVAKGPAAYPRAESVLRSVIENNPLLTPEAEEFKQALFELTQLYYRTGRYEDAIARSQEWTARYPSDDRLGQMLFLEADSYRKSAALFDTKPTAVASIASKEATAAGLAEAAAAKKDRLQKSGALFQKVVDLYQDVLPKTEIDRLDNKLSHFYRADCFYDLAQYDEAIRLYDAAAFRYQDDPASLAAYVQIVNAYYALGKPDEAKAANERAKWMLKRMPAEAFNDGSFAMPREYWENQLKWSSQSGMW